jgi:drug/metabolite transporter (DMT)-like permease
MSWFFIAIAAYFFGAIANVLDKLLLGSKRISSPVVYAFYVGIFGLASFMFAPFGFSMVGGNTLFLCLISGIIFLGGITLLYFSIEKAEAGRVVPVVGATIPLVTFILAAIFGIEIISAKSILALALLVGGGLIISFDLPFKIGKKKLFAGFFLAFLAGIAMAISYIMFKYISASENFVTWYIWTRVGITVGAFLLLINPSWRKKIINSFSGARKNGKQAASTGGIFISNKIMGGMSTLLVNYAIGIGSVTMVNALVSLQYIFLLVFVAILSTKNHDVYKEKLTVHEWIQKVSAIIIIGIGVVLIS